MKSKMKNVLLMGLSLVLVAVIAIGGTVAYLTDTDSDVNVMTLGNVKIAQHEYQRATNEDGSYMTDTIDNQKSYVLEAFEQGKALLPATDPTNNGAGNWDSTTVRMSQVDSYGGMQVFVNSNVQDKFVTVENTGKTDAYVRTLVAIEVGTGSIDLIGISARATEDADDAGENTPWFKNQVGVVSIGGVNYYMLEYVYAGGKLSDGTYRHANGVLPAGDTTYPNLSQVYLKSAATNEDCENLDGNDNGTLDILVFSQAVQADGFANATTALDTAFGDITTDNHPWVEIVSSVEDLEQAIADGATTVVLGNDIALNAQLEVNGELTILGNGNTVTAPANGTRVINVKDNTEDVVINLTGVTLDGGDVQRGISFYNNSGALDVTIIGCEIVAKDYGLNVSSGNTAATLTVKDSTLTGYCAFQTWSANTVATFDNCTLTGVNRFGAEGANAFATIVINGDASNSKLTFNNCTIVATENGTAREYHLIDNSDGSTVTWNNCTFIKNGVEVETDIAPAVK